MFSIFISL
jgi:hypothetical protein